jgi:hypothetical protein
VRNQNVYGSCAGQAVAFWASRFADRKLSATHLWTEARRIEYNISGIDKGASLDHAIDALRNTGSPSFRGDENDPTQENTARYTLGDTLGDQLDADDNRPARVDVWSIPCDKSAPGLIQRAIADGCGVVFASGLRDPFWDGFYGNSKISINSFGGMRSGHAQAIVGVSDFMDTLTVVNSWGLDFGFNGSYAVSVDAIPLWWEIRVFKSIARGQ